LRATANAYAMMTLRVGSGGDALWTDPRGQEVNRILDELARIAPADATLAVAPEGIMLNYLTRRVNPTPYITLMPVEVIMFGEQRILDAFQRSPPDYLVMTDESTSDYGFPNFGDGYAVSLFNWMRANYQAIGQPPSDAPAMLHAVLLVHNATAGDDSRKSSQSAEEARKRSDK
jgi:hypothetical protein